MIVHLTEFILLEIINLLEITNLLEFINQPTYSIRTHLFVTN